MICEHTTTAGRPAQPDVHVSFDLAASDRDSATALTLHRQTERQAEKIATGLPSASFAYGRRNSILDLVKLRFDGPCDTDDADLIVELIVPFIVEAASLHLDRFREPRDPHAAARLCIGHAFEAWAEKNGQRLNELVAASVDTREAAVAAHDPREGRHVAWLPTMPELVKALRPTRDEVQRLGLRGWGCIDPLNDQERRAADAARKRASRAAKGAKPQAQSEARRKPWEILNMSKATYYRHKSAGTLPGLNVETASSGPYREEGEYGADVSVSPPSPDNDNTAPIEAVAA